MKFPSIEKIASTIRSMNRRSHDPRGLSQTRAEPLRSFSILTEAYERELDEKYGITLRDLPSGARNSFKGSLERNVSFNGGNEQSVEQIEEEILAKYSDIPGFCSMKVSGWERLFEHTRKVHELSYNHYVFGKKTNMRGMFPNCCCGRSAKNLLLTLMEKGYPNASYFYNGTHEHAYVGLPFIFGENQEMGFIIVDPTSDQLFEDKEHAPKNLTFVASGTTWEYETDWVRGANLFPDPRNDSSFSNLHTLRTSPDPDIRASTRIRKYFKRVFKNPVEVEIEDF